MPKGYYTFLDKKKERNISLRAEQVVCSFCFVLLETPAYEADEPENMKPQRWVERCSVGLSAW